MSKVIHCEVLLKSDCHYQDPQIANAVRCSVQTLVCERVINKNLDPICIEDEEGDLAKYVIRIDVFNSKNELWPFNDFRDIDEEGYAPSIKVYLYKLDGNGPQKEHYNSPDEDNVSVATTWLLPSADFDGIWPKLIYEEHDTGRNLKVTLMNYVHATLFLSKRDIDVNEISCNRILLLHGPPGNGKTSLCRALAHQLSIRLTSSTPNSVGAACQPRALFRYAQLIEINAHSLFSRWFSESGKLVMKMFDTIKEIVDDPQSLVFLLIDEVESLAAVRRSSANDPSDAIRVVNALLTQVDQMRHLPNIIICTTSNITGSIDLAFVDRADLKFYVGNPSASAIYAMLASSVIELIKKAVLTSGCAVAPHFSHCNRQHHEAVNEEMLSYSSQLFVIASQCIGLSGRCIRKLPLLTIVNMIDVISESQSSLSAFLAVLEATVKDELSDRSKLGASTNSHNDYSPVDT